MALPRRLKRCEVSLEVGELVGRSRPIFFACLPKRAKTLLVRGCVLDDEGADAFRMGERHAKANGSAVVLHEQNIARDAELRCEFIHHAREIVERVFEGRRGGRAAMAETGVVGRYEMIFVAQEG